MAYIALPIRTSNDLNAASDINQLQENCDYLRSIVDAPYSAYYVQSTPPSDIAYGTLWYDTTTNKLYRYLGGWNEIDWQTIVRATPEWQAGTLRVSSGVLQITPNSGTNWYNCYPLVGSKIFKITDYTKKYYQTIGTFVLTWNTTQIPIVFAREMLNHFRLYLAVDQPIRLFVSNTASSGYFWMHYNTSLYGHSSYSNSTERLLLKDKDGSSSVCDIMLEVFVARTASIEYNGHDGVMNSATSIAMPSTAYYLGVLNGAGTTIIERKATI